MFVFEAPLYRPGLYDDVEVPNLFRLDDRYYLMGSIREDTKIHYWYADTQWKGRTRTSSTT